MLAGWEACRPHRLEARVPPVLFVFSFIAIDLLSFSRPHEGAVGRG
jgi:hypothetical protein